MFGTLLQGQDTKKVFESVMQAAIFVIEYRLETRLGFWIPAGSHPIAKL
jgi:hypothetical protein